MYKIYQIEYGDTLDTIARKVNTTIDELISINGFSNNYMPGVGNLIIVPNKDEVFTTYIVQSGDNLYSIARMFNIDPNTLLMINGLNKTDYIYPNQEVLVPNNNVVIYITKEGDTMDDVLNNLEVDLDTLIKENNKIFIEEDQLMIHKIK